IQTIKIICIDYTEGLFNRMSCCKNSMTCSPWLCSFYFKIKPVLFKIKVLKYIIGCDLSIQFWLKYRLEIIYEFFFDNKYDLSKASLYSIIYGIIDYRFSI